MGKKLYGIVMASVCFALASCGVSGYRDIQFGDSKADLENTLIKQKKICSALIPYTPGAGGDALRKELFPKSNEQYQCVGGYWVGGVRKETIILMLNKQVSGVVLFLDDYNLRLYAGYENAMAEKYEVDEVITTEDLKIFKNHSGYGDFRIRKITKFANGQVILGIIEGGYALKKKSGVWENLVSELDGFVSKVTNPTQKLKPVIFAIYSRKQSFHSELDTETKDEL